jgi:pilus assembly protein CpaB
MLSRPLQSLVSGLLLVLVSASKLAGQQPAETVDGVLASQDIAAGTVITAPESLFKKVRIPKELDLASAVRNLEQLKGKVIVRAIEKNQIVSTRDIVTADDLVAKVPAGQRAMSFKVQQDKAADGFVLPGSRVDVIVTQPDEKNKDETVSKVALQNLLVLAVNADKDQSKPTLITVAVTPEDAEKLHTLATRFGPLSIVLRMPDKK